MEEDKKRAEEAMAIAVNRTKYPIVFKAVAIVNHPKGYGTAETTISVGDIPTTAQVKALMDKLSMEMEPRGMSMPTKEEFLLSAYEYSTGNAFPNDLNMNSTPFEI